MWAYSSSRHQGESSPRGQIGDGPLRSRGGHDDTQVSASGFVGRIKSSMIECVITHQHLQLGLKGNPPFLDVSTHVPRLPVAEPMPPLNSSADAAPCVR
jgi:hypothetical protein